MLLFQIFCKSQRKFSCSETFCENLAISEKYTFPNIGALVCLCFHFMAVLSSLSWQRVTSQAGMSGPTCSGCSVPVVLSQMSCPDCPIMAVLPQLSCPSFPVLQLSCLSYQVLDVLSCPGFLFPTVLFGCSVPAVNFQLP